MISLHHYSDSLSLRLSPSAEQNKTPLGLQVLLLLLLQIPPGITFIHESGQNVACTAFAKTPKGKPVEESRPATFSLIFFPKSTPPLT